MEMNAQVECIDRDPEVIVRNIIEAVEDFLKVRGIRIPSSDILMLGDGYENPAEENEALFYGADYLELENAIMELI